MEGRGITTDVLPQFALPEVVNITGKEGKSYFEDIKIIEIIFPLCFFVGKTTTLTLKDNCEQ